MSPVSDYVGVAEAARFQPKRSVTVYHIASPQWKGLSHQDDSNALPM